MAILQSQIQLPPPNLPPHRRAAINKRHALLAAHEHEFPIRRHDVDHMQHQRREVRNRAVFDQKRERGGIERGSWLWIVEGDGGDCGDGDGW